MKVRPQYYQGIEYIHLSQLSFDQESRIKSWLSVTSIFTIAKNEQTLNDCVHYEDYEYWYENQFLFESEENLAFEASF